MKQPETARENRKQSFEKEMSELLHEQILFAEGVYAHLPMGVEIYDKQGILRSINDHALRMYGVTDLSEVLDKINLFDSPYVDGELKAKIQSGEDITLEFEYDFELINKEYFSTRSQNTIIYEARIVAVRNRKGEILGICCSPTT